jgi:hypothetical protein
MTKMKKNELEAGGGNEDVVDDKSELTPSRESAGEADDGRCFRDGTSDSAELTC